MVTQDSQPVPPGSPMLRNGEPIADGSQPIIPQGRNVYMMQRIRRTYSVPCFVIVHTQGWEGSAFQVWLWRAAGAHVGRDCCLLGGDRMEQDLLNIGDRVVIGQGGILQGHTIENHQLQVRDGDVVTHK